MAGFSGISAAGKSIERLMNAAFQELQPLAGQRTRAVLARAADFEPAVIGDNIGAPALSIFVYRVDFNKTMRAAWSGAGSYDGLSHLPLDLHLLLTAWADNAEFELRILGRAMQAIESNPILAGPYLERSADWAPNESVQIVLEDVQTEAIMRIFDSLPTTFRLSVPYIARIVRVDGLRTSQETFVSTLVAGAVPEPRP